MSLATGKGGGSTAVANRGDGDQLREFLERGKKQLAIAAARHISPDRLIRLALTARSKQPQLRQCSADSVALSLLMASAIGLEPDGWNGHLVAYGNTCQFLPDYKGFIKLIYQNQRVKDVQAAAVRKGDLFEYELGLNASLRHVPANDGPPGELTHAWAMVRFKDNANTFIVLTKADVEKRRMASMTGKKNSGPWADWTESMWCKTAIKALAKRAPLGEQAERASELDSRIDVGHLVTTPEHVNQIALGETPDVVDAPTAEGGESPDATMGDWSEKDAAAQKA